MATAMTKTTNPPVTDNATNTNIIASVTPDNINKEATVETNDVPVAVIEPNNDTTQRGATVTALAEISVGSSLQPHRSDMIWNMTKARRVMQSRSTTTHTTTLLSVVHIPYHRTFSAQRRIFSDSTASTATTLRRSTNVLSQCDTQGRSSMHSCTPPPAPPLTNDENDDDPTEEWRPDHHSNNNNHMTGLRQRRGRNVQSNSQRMNEEVVSPLESSHSTGTETLKKNDDTDDMIVSLLLLSSGTGTTSDLILPIQTKSRQLLQYLTTIQTHLVQQLQQEINNTHVVTMMPPNN